MASQASLGSADQQQHVIADHEPRRVLTMFLKIDEGFADGELPLLAELLELLDAKLADIQDEVAGNVGPESAGLMDRGEYFLGVGLCAVQQYLVDTLTPTRIPKDQALKLGPATTKNVSVIAAVDAGANWWKHNAEWWPPGKVPSIGKRTFETVEGIVDGNTDYALSNLLAELLGSPHLRLVNLIPCLVDWRAQVDRARREGTL